MKKYGVALSFFMVFALSIFAEIPQPKQVAQLANQYSSAIDDYNSMHLGSLEQSSKKSLRDSYLSCSVSDTELIYKLGAYTEVIRRLKEWRLKCSKGLLYKVEPTVSVNEFVELAQQYAMLHKQVSQSPEYQKHMQAHSEYKKTILNLLKQGFTVAHINDTLKSYGISNAKVLSRTEYWKKKEL